MLPERRKSHRKSEEMELDVTTGSRGEIILWIALRTSFLSLPYSVYLFYQLLRKERRSLHYNCELDYFSLQLYQLWSHGVWTSVVRCTPIWDCYLSLENLSLYHYVMSLFITNNISCSGVYFMILN